MTVAFEVKHSFGWRIQTYFTAFEIIWWIVFEDKKSTILQYLPLVFISKEMCKENVQNVLFIQDL